MASNANSVGMEKRNGYSLVDVQEKIYILDVVTIITIVIITTIIFINNVFVVVMV